jgi:hypothetical protein
MKNYFKYSLLIVLAAALIMPVAAKAATTQEVQAQIQAIMAQIQLLQQQIAQLQAQQGGIAQWCHTFDVNLRYGDQSSEVEALMMALEKEGFNMPEKKYLFDEGVASAVVGFQQKYKDEILTPVGLKYGTGFVGKSTRAKLNQLYGCGVTPPQACAQVITPATNPLTGECKNFPTPCDVPAGWQKVNSCEIPTQSSITVLSPNGGEVWQRGSLQYIKWVSVSGADFDIFLVSATDRTKYTMAEVAGSLGSFAWTVGKVADVQVPPDGKYLIRMAYTNSASLSAFDESNAPFSIVTGVAGPTDSAAASVSIQSGLCVRSSSSYGKTFTDIDAGSILVGSQTYGLKALPGITAGANQTINFYAYVPSSGSTAYVGTAVAGSREDATAFLPNRVLIARVVSGSNPADTTSAFGGVIQSMTSYAPGCPNYSQPITTQPSIQVLSPNGGEVWQVGSTQMVKWTSSNPGPTCGVDQASNACAQNKIDVIRLRNSSGQEINLLTNTLNDGTEQIIVPSLPTGSYTLEIKTFAQIGYSVMDTSDASFNIVAGTQSTVSLSINASPLGATSGRVMNAVDDIGNLTFTTGASDATLNYVRLYISGTAPTSQNFNVGLIDPTTGAHWAGSIDEPLSNYCIVNNNPLGCFTTFFLSPGYVLSAGTSKTVKVRINSTSFTSGGTLSVYIKSPSDVNRSVNGSTGSNIFAQFPLTITNLSYAGGGTVSSSITVLSPNGGERWIMGEQRLIQWTGTFQQGGAAFEVYLVDASGKSWTITATDGNSLLWIVGKVSDVEQPSAGMYYIRVKQGSNADQSDAAFNIVAFGPTTGTVTVTTPNGGETLGLTYVIRWTSSGFGPDAWAQIQLRDSIDSSKMVNLIVNSTTNIGSYNWTIPTTIPDGKYLIWVTIGSGLDSLGTRVLGSDYSDAPFSISRGMGALAPAGQYTASILENMKITLDQIQKAINDLYR